MTPVIKFSKPKIDDDSSCRRINITKNGVPFGQIWTWQDTNDEWHPWHFHANNGVYFVQYVPGSERRRPPMAVKTVALESLKAKVEHFAKTGEHPR